MHHTFSHYRSLNPIRRWIRARACREHIELDWQFFQSEPEYKDQLAQAARVLGLDVAAIDYSTPAGGSVVLWEANPHFALHMWPFDVPAGPRRLKRRFRRYHDVIGDFFACLLQQSL
ncbi:MAG: hypothetical protein FJW20_16825 [Acidimicrobiia bacterium]|nr:hypothetical protein [Acidimicrobiia bacterium]